MAFLKFIEVYEEADQRLYDRESDKSYNLLSAVETNFSLREITINSEYVSLIRIDKMITKMHKEGRLPTGISEDAEFAKLYINCGSSSSSGLRSITVVGSLDMITKKLGSHLGYE